LNYIGSKYSLLSKIESTLDGFGVPAQGVAFDAFSGTGAVAQFLKARGHTVYANDWQQYSYVTNRAFLMLDRIPTFRKLLEDQHWGPRIRSTQNAADAPVFSILARSSERKCGVFAYVAAYLGNLEGRRGSFFEEYCEGGLAGRSYYSEENGLRIQEIRDCIEEWFSVRLIDELEHSWLVAAVIESADRVANTASVYAAYLKHIKRSAQKPMRILSPEPIGSSISSQNHRVFRGDVLEILARHSDEKHVLTYIDPPYNHRQYASYYHILETISRWDLGSFTPRLKTGLREKTENLSPFCMKTRAYAAFDDLFGLVKSKNLLFSYSNEGVLSEDELRELFEAHFEELNFEKVNYQRFRADKDGVNRNYSGDTTSEFLILARGKKKRTQPVVVSKSRSRQGPSSGPGGWGSVSRSRGQVIETQNSQPTFPYYKVQIFDESLISWKDEKPQFQSIQEAEDCFKASRLANKQTRIMIVEARDKRRELARVD